MPSLPTASIGGIVPLVVEPTAAMTTTTATTTAATATTTTRILTNRKAYTTPFTSATGSSTTTAGTTSTIHAPAPDATTLGLNQNSTSRESNTISIMANKRQLAERKRQPQNNHQAALDPSAGAKPGAVSGHGPAGGNHRESEDYDSLESPPLEETLSSVIPRTGATTTTQSSPLISNPHILWPVLNWSMKMKYDKWHKKNFSA